MHSYTCLSRISFVVLALTTCHALAESPTARWSYSTGADGPAHWGELDPSFEACGLGANQSPMDIRDAVPSDLPALDFNYTTTAASFSNNGHTVQVDVPDGQTLTVGGRTYTLLQFHFHAPSETALLGKRAAMSVHFVHKDKMGEITVVEALAQPGKTNAAFAPVFEHLPRKGEKITVDQLSLDLASMLPAGRGYYAYSGSLTTPPCAEAIQWVVLKSPIFLGADQIKAFRTLIGENARPLQPRNGRTIQASK